jgi:YHS domain-containing protein
MIDTTGKQCYTDWSVEKQISGSKPKSSEVMHMYLDVVCNTEIDEKTAKYRSVYNAKRYFFCSPECKRKFDLIPVMYVRSQG